ncbi:MULTISPECIES: flagellar motor protein MotP [Pontibacillus]|uniref:Flagellar motor protein MotP n=1 Tax=Pontibacillus chungwhensis TaxID=265426 RepID=A0ABY8UUA3_9BACI|nr:MULTISPECIES: flagellar motor protein MotP [Pontibacillus]MCD5323889.1 flagellar motor protein MotP [Pontibacillus sp. HN14]WIF97247.1 flagellar motor protein MotP [Pontibacillus chungwhensis]
MKRNDLLTPIGIFIGITMIFVGIFTTGGASDVVSFIQISSMIIVLGGLAAALLINFTLDEIKLTGKVLKESFQTNDQNLSGLIDLFVRLSERARREGLLALESELEEVEDPFIKKGILLAVDGIEPEVINDIMNAEISAIEERHRRGRAIIEKAAEYAPAWGMIGTLIGLVLMLKNLTDPTTLGPNMAIALLTTFYGSVLANLVFSPMAGKLANKTDQEIFIKQVTIEGVIGVQSGQNPKILEEKLSAFLSGNERQRQEEQPTEDLMGETPNEA